MSSPSIVIGGGPAGSAAAIELARGGREVCLLERKQGAHDKVCGEFVSWEAAHYLQRLGIDLPAMGAEPIRAVRLYNGKQILQNDLPFRAWSVSRCRLDARLLQQAEREGVSLRHWVAVKDVLRTNGAWLVATRQGEQLCTHSLFLANGKHELRGWRRREAGRTPDLIAFKMHLRLHGVQQQKIRENVELFLFDDGYAGLEPIEEGRANLCLVISRDTYHDCNNSWLALLAQLGSVSPVLETRLADAECLWPQPLAVYGTPYGYIFRPDSGGPGLFRLGDQMAVIPSFAGDGIAIALHSGVLAAGVHLSGGGSTDYHRQARRDFAAPVRNAQTLASLLSNRFVRKAGFALLAQWPSLVRHASSRIRLTEAQLKHRI